MKEISEKDIIGLEFLTIETTEICDRKYSFYVGFSVIKDDKRYDGDRVIVKRRWVCCKANLRPTKRKSNSRKKANY